MRIYRNSKQVVESLKLQQRNTAKMVEVQKVTSADLLIVESQLSHAMTSLLNYKNQLYIAKLNLCQLLEIENYEDFEMSEADNVLVPREELPKDVSEVLNSAQWLPELKMAELEVDLATQDVRIAQSSYYPSISLSASYGSSYSSAREKALINPDETYKYEAYPFMEQYTDNLNGYISLGVYIPIFNRMVTRTSVERCRVAVRKAEFTQQSIRKQVSKEVNQSYIDMTISWQRYNLTQKYLESAQEALRQIEIKYNYGASTIVDYNTAVDAYVDATTKHTQAKYEYIFKTRIIEFYLGLANL